MCEEKEGMAGREGGRKGWHLQTNSVMAPHTTLSIVPTSFLECSGVQNKSVLADRQGEAAREAMREGKQ